jgi:purine-cytosine permease-like protein
MKIAILLILLNIVFISFSSAVYSLRWSFPSISGEISRKTREKLSGIILAKILASILANTILRRVLLQEGFRTRSIDSPGN